MVYLCVCVSSVQFDIVTHIRCNRFSPEMKGKNIYIKDLNVIYNAIIQEININVYVVHLLDFIVEHVSLYFVGFIRSNSIPRRHNVVMLCWSFHRIWPMKPKGILYSIKFIPSNYMNTLPYATKDHSKIMRTIIEKKKYARIQQTPPSSFI